MSQQETQRAGSGGLALQIKHVGTSLLPLALFVGGALGYEQFAKSNAPQPKQMTVFPVRHAEAPPRITAAALSAQTASPRTSNIAPTKIVPSLRDERSLLDLAVSTTPSQEAAPDLRLTPAASAPLPPKVEPSVTEPPPSTTAEISPAPVDEFRPLKLAPLSIIAPGTYAVVRGLHQSAQLSHGLPVGNDAWLVDGGDVKSLGIAWRSSSPFEPFELDVIVLSGESRVLSRSRVKVAADNLVKADRDLTAKLEPALAAAPVTGAPTTLSAPESVKLSIAPETNLLPGRGSLVFLNLEPADAVPAGSYIVLRGLPEHTSVSRGFDMGRDTWLLSITDLANLEVRLPASTGSPVDLDVRLISADGQLLASDKRAIQNTTARGARQLAALPDTSAPPALPAAPAPAQPAARGAIIAPAVKAPEPAAPKASVPQTTASVPPAAPPSPGPHNSNAAEVPSLSRGRKMLETGNIAIARQLLERAASSGSREAAVLLASSFDPAWLRRAGVIGIEGDSEVAKRWMLEARRIGTLDTPAQRPKAR